jgi:hypothetical protein
LVPNPTARTTRFHPADPNIACWTTPTVPCEPNTPASLMSGEPRWCATAYGLVFPGTTPRTSSVCPTRA